MSIKLEVGQIVQLNDGDSFTVKEGYKELYQFSIDQCGYTYDGKFEGKRNCPHNVKRIISEPTAYTPHKPETLSRRDQFAMAAMVKMIEQYGAQNIDQVPLSTTILTDAMIAELDKEKGNE